MSTPTNPEHAQPNGGGPRGDQSHRVDVTKCPQGAAASSAEVAPPPVNPGGFVPGQGVAPALNSAAPTQARLPQRLGEDGKNTPIGFGRLVVVELRKQLDTRAGKVLMGATAALIIVISALVAYNTRDNPQFLNLMGAAAIPMNYLLPILGIMAVTSEWSQRTGLVTFTLEPRRARVALAKWVSALVLAGLATLIAFASAALFTLLAGALGSGHADWNIKGVGYATILLGMLLQVSMGVAFGLLIQNTPGAICSFLFIPIVVSMLNFFSWARSALEWINPNQSTQPLWDGSIHGNGWGKLAVSMLIWLVIPMVFGFVRLTRREVKSS